MTKKFLAIIEKEGSWFVGLCPELDVASQGRTMDEALANLKEAVELYLEHADPSEVEDIGTPFITTLQVAPHG